MGYPHQGPASRSDCDQASASEALSCMIICMPVESPQHLSTQEMWLFSSNKVEVVHKCGLSLMFMPKGRWRYP